MLSNNEQAKDQDKLTLGLSLFVALCIVVLFCAISVAIAKNVESMSQGHEAQYIPLPSLEDDNTNSLLL